MSDAKKKTDEGLEIPARLQLDPFFKEILSLDADKLFDFNLKALQSLGYTDIKSYWHPTDGYIFARGTLPVCLCAHMDKVPHYHHLKNIHKQALVSKKGKVVDVLISSKQGIGGDDRCGVYAILYALKLGHRPSVLFCMGEEIGCRGSHKFVTDVDKDFLKDVNAFVQIDRRGSNDCVRYSDSNPKLTEAMTAFGYQHAYGSCSDISVLMPYFGISGVNLSSGYYNEHRANLEYVSISDVKKLLVRLDKILHSDIFKEKYVYKDGYSYSGYSSSRFSSYGGSSHSRSGVKQLSLFKDLPYIEPFIDDLTTCDYCGEQVFSSDTVETDDPLVSSVCKDCAKELEKLGFIRCSSCGKLFENKIIASDSSDRKICPFCGCCNDEQ